MFRVLGKLFQRYEAAKMQSVLQQMDTLTLRTIGIERKDIPAVVREIVNPNENRAETAANANAEVSRVA